MRTLIGILVLVSVIMLAWNGRAYAEEPTHTKDALDTVKQNLKDGKAVLVDVREQKEWDEGHIAGALFMPKSKLDIEKEAADLAKKLDKNKIVYTHCRAGRRALACGEILKKQGFDVRALKPGYEELIKAGFEKAK
ncbi:MAG: rhodanese-like domain-containing protein [Pirellulaceae bacterium]